MDHRNSCLDEEVGSGTEGLKRTLLALEAASHV